MSNINQSIFERYSNVSEAYKNKYNPSLQLTMKEHIFLQLVYYFEAPDKNQFSLNHLYTYLKDDDLLFALDCIIQFFQTETTLVSSASQSFYDKSLSREPLVGQKGFSELVEGSLEGVKFRPSMINQYWKRNSKKIPRPDLIIEERPYWKKSTVYEFIRQKETTKGN